MTVHLPCHPRAAYLIVNTGDIALEPISWRDYLAAINRLPQASVQEIREADHDAMTASILICRRQQLEMLRARWIADPVALDRLGA